MHDTKFLMGFAILTICLLHYLVTFYIKKENKTKTLKGKVKLWILIYNPSSKNIDTPACNNNLPLTYKNTTLKIHLGIANIPLIKKIIQSITLIHSYFIK